MHLGRRPASLPATLEDHDVDPDDLRPRAAWRRLVDRALEARVEAVVLAGDVVESDSARFEARGPLESGVRRLVDGGVRVLAVAGNHDVDALPKLAREVEGFDLIGAAGQWEERELERFKILGWSYPTSRVTRSPLESLRVESGSKPLLGVLHCDVDKQEGSPYAPVTTTELRAAPVAAWFLGHVHAPSLTPGTGIDVARRPIGYLGSITPLHRGEVGTRGPWSVGWSGDDGSLDLEQLALAPLRFEGLEVQLPQGADPYTAIARAARDRLATLARDDARDDLRILVLHVRLSGEFEDAIHVRSEIERLPLGDLTQTIGDRIVFVTRITSDLRVAHDLVALARGTDAIAALASELLELERGAPRLIARLQDREAEIRLEARFREVGSADVADARERLLRAGHAALSRMLIEVAGSES